MASVYPEIPEYEPACLLTERPEVDFLEGKRIEHVLALLPLSCVGDAAVRPALLRQGEELPHALVPEERAEACRLCAHLMDLPRAQRVIRLFLKALLNAVPAVEADADLPEFVCLTVPVALCPMRRFYVKPAEVREPAVPVRFCLRRGKAADAAGLPFFSLFVPAVRA